MAIFWECEGCGHPHTGLMPEHCVECGSASMRMNEWPVKGGGVSLEEASSLVGKRVEVTTSDWKIHDESTLACIAFDSEEKAFLVFDDCNIPLSQVWDVREVSNSETLMASIERVLGQYRRPPQEMLALARCTREFASKLLNDAKEAATPKEAEAVQKLATLFGHLANLAAGYNALVRVLGKAQIALEEHERILGLLPPEVLEAVAVEECPTCGGVGTIGTEAKECWVCKGSGRRPKEEEDSGGHA